MMQVVSLDVIEPLSQTRVIFFRTHQEPRRKAGRFLGQRPGAFAQFRQVTAGTKEGLAESPQRPKPEFFGSAQRAKSRHP